MVQCLVFSRLWVSSNCCIFFLIICLFSFWPIHIFKNRKNIYTLYHYNIIYNIDRAALEQAYRSLCKLSRNYIQLMLCQCHRWWPTLKQHWFNILCFLDDEVHLPPASSGEGAESIPTPSYSRINLPESPLMKNVMIPLRDDGTALGQRWSNVRR